MKTCTKCGVSKTPEEFGLDRNKKDGLPSWCKKCNAEGGKKYYAANKETIARKAKKYRVKNKEAIASYTKKYQAENKEAIASYYKKYCAANKGRVAAKNKKYRAENMAHYAQLEKYRNVQKLRAVPAWFEKAAVELVYAKAQEWDMHVDHIIPLQSKTVCGLHCHANLQLLDGSLNQSKSNHYEQDQ